jgi:hypothetical protein
MRIKKAKHQYKNLNRILRMRNNDIHNCLVSVAVSLGMPYQTVFEDWCDLMTSGFTHGKNTRDILYGYCLEKHTRKDK